MNLSPGCRHLTALIMTVVMILMSLPIGVAQAGMVSTQTLIEQATAEPASGVQADEQRQRLTTLLARDDVQAEMIGLGITPREAEARVAAMTDEEIASVVGRLDELPAGEGVGTILVVIFVVFGLAVILDAMGMMNIFPFVCGPGECGGQVQAYYPEPAAGPPVESYGYDDRRSYRGDPFDDRSDRRRQSFGTNEYYEPQPQPPRGRNYYEERFGTQRYVR